MLFFFEMNAMQKKEEFAVGHAKMPIEATNQITEFHAKQN